MAENNDFSGPTPWWGEEYEPNFFLEMMISLHSNMSTYKTANYRIAIDLVSNKGNNRHSFLEKLV